ncbi:HD-GYP domain-containing protein [Paenibacillus yanchengensis]|uniref:HD-GYP domain-containing protein n=1 Tax=Paenibacillus yanchengensis TaxID=2035833 RepID=A0ABW4YPI6_9BACL
MGNVLLTQLQLGDKIQEDVVTPLGGILMRRGDTITERTVEILQAFLIASVAIEDGTEPIEENKNFIGLSDTPRASMEQQPKQQLQVAYKQMFQLLKKLYQSYTVDQPFPLLDVRVQLNQLLQHITTYNVLTFVPDHYTEQDYYIHNNVCSALTAYKLAQWSDMKQQEWMQIALAGLLKDIGYVKVDRNILVKPETLTDEELEEVHQHTVKGYQLLKNIAALNEGAKLASLQHHERADGTGYPLGIHDKNIHQYAKIISIVDTYHAMTLRNTYRHAISPYLVLEKLHREAFGKLDPYLVTLFIEKATQFHSGKVVRLSDNRVGMIIFSDRQQPTRPWVNVDGQIINLINERNLYIKEIIDVK